MIMLYLAAAQAAVGGALPPATAPRPETGIAATTSNAGTVVLPRDTPVEMMATAEVSTAAAKPGTIFRLRVNKAILVGGRIVVPVGVPAFGQVVTATDSGGLGKSGRMTAKLLHLKLGDAEIPLEGEMSAKGTGAGSAGVAVLFTGVVGLFHRGNNAKIKAGEILTGFVREDVTLDLSSADARRVVASTTAVPDQAPLLR